MSFTFFFQADSITTQVWFMRGSGVVQAWFRRGPGAFERGSEHQLQPYCLPRVVQWGLNYGSGVVQAWFRRGLVAAQTWIGTCHVNTMSSTNFARVVPLWFRRGSCVVPAWFRFGPEEFGRGSEHQLEASCLPRVVQWGLNYGSGVVQAWFRRGSGAAQTRIGT